ncbi:MAG: P-loop NTPase, partial [Candidatus Aenigmarchaeota archaeon]|nr:P-loop NTPase [Candidatus Aenigmarchaeota archaeon]
MTRIIGIVSGKGGVGKTTLALNMAAAIAKHYNKRTTVIDCNLTTPHIGLYLGLYQHPVTFNNVLRGERSVEEAMQMHESGMKIIPASLALNDLDGIDILHIRDRIKSLMDKEDIIILDSAPGLGREALGTLKASDEVIFVANPNILSLTDAIRCNEVCQELGIKNLGIILNMVNRDKYDLNAKDVERVAGIPVIGVIPYH